MKKDSLTILGCLGYVIYFLLAFPASIIVHGWVLSILWGWFIAPIFNFPELTIPCALGITATFSLFTKHNIGDNKKDFAKLIKNNEKNPSKFTKNNERDLLKSTKDAEEDFVKSAIKSFIYAFIAPLLTLGYGWIILQFTH